MHRTRIARWGLIALGIALAAASAVTTEAAFPPAADDNPYSMGQLLIWVRPEFRGAVTSIPSPPIGPDICYDPVTFELISPVLYEQPGGQTIIGRSGPFLEGSSDDTGGIPVGSLYPLPVRDGDIVVQPPGSEAPGEFEVHTKITRLVLTDTTGLITLRAGNHPDANPFGNEIPISRRLSPGEVESKPGDASSDFPALSYFNVFVEVDVPGIGTLFNLDPLLVVNDSITAFPPSVVYLHGVTPAVAVYRKSDSALFGYLRLAGHGVGNPCCVQDSARFAAAPRCGPATCGGAPATPGCESSDAFVQFMAGSPKMACPNCVDLTVDLTQPDHDTLGLPSVNIPIDVSFGIRGACRTPTHDVVKLSWRDAPLGAGCLLFDGNTYGDRDGMLSDESLQITKYRLCQAMAACGKTSLAYPTVVVESTDPCGFTASARRIIRLRLLKSEVCGL